MPVQAIKRAGVVIAYQARVGSGGPGHTRCFTVAAHPDAEALAHAALPGLLAATGVQPRTNPRTAPTAANSTGVPGLTARYEGNTLRIGATWIEGGRNCATGYSAELHGLHGATALALAARERGAGIVLGLTARKALAMMRPHLQRIGVKNPA